MKEYGHFTRNCPVKKEDDRKKAAEKADEE